MHRKGMQTPCRKKPQLGFELKTFFPQGNSALLDHMHSKFIADAQISPLCWISTATARTQTNVSLADILLKKYQE